MPVRTDGCTEHARWQSRHTLHTIVRGSQKMSLLPPYLPSFPEVLANPNFSLSTQTLSSRWSQSLSSVIELMAVRALWWLVLESKTTLEQRTLQTSSPAPSSP